MAFFSALFMRVNLSKRVYVCTIWVTICFCLTSTLWAQSDTLSEHFGAQEDAVAEELIASLADPDTAAVYRDLSRTEKGLFLRAFWKDRNPLVLKYYYGYHLGEGHFSVSDAYFEQGDLIAIQFHTGATAPDTQQVSEAARICETVLAKHPEDRVAQCALGYLRLERSDVKTAEGLFRKSLKDNKRFVEARNGWALAVLKMDMQNQRARDLFRDAVSMDKTYPAALYNLAMCHLALGKLDPAGVDKYFARVVEHFPDHYDAYFKRGAVLETFQHFEQALEAYSQQLDVNPAHDVARAKMAQSALVILRDGDIPFELSKLTDFVEQDPLHFLPLLAEAAVREGDLGKAEAAYDRYLPLLKPDERAYYEDLKLLSTPEEQRAFEKVYSRPDQDLFRKKFWMENDPTPTTLVNERRVEHFRRVNYARLRFSQGVQPWDGRGWDRRGDVYIRLGHPNHKSRSERLVFETDPGVAKVKNRLNAMADGPAMEEVVQSKHLFGSTDANYGYGVGPQTSDIKGMPTFPLPSRKTWMPDGTELSYKWESWIYAEVGGGIEVTFLDLTGKGFYDYAIPPPNSRNYKLWQRLAPETVVARVTNETPSVYAFDYGGDPLGVYVYTADFKVSDWNSDLEIYIGVPWSELGQRVEEGRAYAGVDREVVLYNRKLEPVYRDSARVVESMPASEAVGPGTLLVDQVRARVPANTYLMAIQVRDPETRKVQIQKRYVALKPFWNKAPALSGLEVAGSVEELEGQGEGKFDKGELRVVPLPSKVFVKGQPVYLYYEIYDLVRDEFGQTRYRVDYLLHGVEQGSTVTRMFKGLGRALGQVPKAEGLQISYEHEGTSDQEPIYVALDVTPSGREEMEVTVTVTDLNTEGEKSVDRKVRFSFGE